MKMPPIKSVSGRCPIIHLDQTHSIAVNLRAQLGRGWFFEASSPEAIALDKALSRFIAVHEDEDQRQSKARFDATASGATS